MYRNEKNPSFYHWNIFDQFSPSITAGVTTRDGGNQALHCGDIPSNVIQNRKNVAESLNISFETYTCAQQTHGSNIELITPKTAGSGRNDYGHSIAETDALITEEKGIFLNIHLADCVPIVIFDSVKKLGALVHAGWKGTVQEIVSKTIRRFIETHGSDVQDIYAGIGPSIGPCCFEIGEDVAFKIKSIQGHSSETVRYENNAYYGDLKKANRDQLLASGLLESHIEISSICTSCRNDLFFSHRKEQGQTGRFAAFLLLK